MEKQDINEQAEDEKQNEILRAEIEEERRREDIQNANEEPIHDWISDNKERLKDEYLDMYEDEFDLFCKVAYYDENNIKY